MLGWEWSFYCINICMFKARPVLAGSHKTAGVCVMITPVFFTEDMLAYGTFPSLFSSRRKAMLESNHERRR